MHVHGWLDVGEAGRIVCPGDWVITTAEGERFPCKPDLFERTYIPVTTQPCADCGNQVGAAYYQDVPGIGDLCIGCHVTRFRAPGNFSTFDSSKEGIDDPDEVA
ncbi:hypothetical protein LCGC14_1078250 [marine sediment metagenome]|uniref:Uncharacterized protein n=1 Tax=marine sediment metagenome TaxID=412755 RepID=A0A0F9MKV8_9ZZZZ